MTHQCTRSHPHENMDEMCELRTEIARLTNELAQVKQYNTELDEICQDLQEMTYTQAMRITELEAKLAEAEKQEPYGWVSQHTTKGMYEWQFNKELSGVYKDTAISILPVYTHPYIGQPRSNHD